MGVAAAGWAGADRPDKTTPDTTAAATTTTAPTASTGPRARIRRADRSGSGPPGSGRPDRAARIGRRRPRIVGGGRFQRARSCGPVRRDGVRVFRGRLRVLRAWPLPLFNTENPPAGRSRPGPADGAVAARCGRLRWVRWLTWPQAERGTQFLGEPAAARVSAGRVLRQRGGQHRVDRRRYSGAPRARGRRVRVDLRVHQGLALVGAERRHAAQELERGARQRVLVGPAVGGAALDLLGREVVEHPGGLVRRDDLAGREDLAHPEIGEIRMAARGPATRIVAVEEDVGWPDITVDHAVRVRRVQGRRELGDYPPRIAERKRAVPAEQRPRVPAGHIAHGSVQDPVRLVSLEDGNDVRMSQRGGGPGLADHPGPEAGVASQFRRHHLERDPAAQPHVPGEVDDCPAALPDVPVQPVTADRAGLPRGGQPDGWRGSPRPRAGRRGWLHRQPPLQ